MDDVTALRLHLTGLVNEDDETIPVSVAGLLELFTRTGRMDEMVDHLRDKIDTAREAKLSFAVRDFMLKINQEVKWKPEVPETSVVKLRLRLIAEEFFELLGAAGITKAALMGDDRMNLDEHIMQLIAGLSPKVDMPEFADALSDLRVVIVGTDAAFGINGDAIDREVMGANMKKLEGKDDEHGKRQKPPGWKPPDIAAELRRQGWVG